MVVYSRAGPFVCASVCARAGNVFFLLCHQDRTMHRVVVTGPCPELTCPESEHITLTDRCCQVCRGGRKAHTYLHTHTHSHIHVQEHTHTPNCTRIHTLNILLVMRPQTRQRVLRICPIYDLSTLFNSLPGNGIPHSSQPLQQCTEHVAV